MRATLSARNRETGRSPDYQESPPRFSPTKSWHRWPCRNVYSAVTAIDVKRSFLTGFLCAAGFFLLLAASAVVTARYVGPHLITVPAPSGEPVGKFDLPRSEESVLALRVEVPLSLLETEFDEELPRRLEGQDRANLHRRFRDGAYAWAVERGEVTLRNASDGIAFTVPIAGAARVTGSLNAEFILLPVDGTTQFRGGVTGVMRPRINSDWQVVPDAEPVLELNDAELNLSGLVRLDIRNLLESQLNTILRRKLLGDENGTAGLVDLRKELRPVWQRMHLAEQVEDEPEVWLTIDPHEIALAPLDFQSPDRIACTVVIRSHTLVTNFAPEQPKPEPLPSLARVDSIPSTRLRIPLVIDMARLNETLGRESFSTTDSRGGNVTFSRIEAIVGREGFVDIGVHVEAERGLLGRGVDGMVWLEGRPVIDYDEQTLAFADLGYTVETRDRLTSATSWLMQDVIVKTIERELRIDLDDYQDRLGEEVRKALESPALPDGLGLTLNEPHIRLSDVYTTTRAAPGTERAPGLVLVVEASGDVSVALSGDFTSRNAVIETAGRHRVDVP